MIENIKFISSFFSTRSKSWKNDMEYKHVSCSLYNINADIQNFSLFR